MMRNAVLAVIILVLGTTTAGAQNWAEKLFTKDGTGASEVSHDFKTVAHGAQLVHRFPVTNIYAFPFDITELRVSCGCLKATASKQTLQPKESGYIEVNMDTTRFTGTISKSVHVAVATPNKQFFSSADLKLSATIRQDVVSNPGQFSFGVVTQGETPTKTVEVEYAGALASTWQITGVETNEAPIEARVQQRYRDDPARPGRVGYDVQVKFRKDVPEGAFKREIYLKTNDPTSPVLPIFVEASVQGLVRVSPTTWDLDAPKVGTANELTVKVSGERPFHVVAVEGQDSDLSLITPLPTESGQALRLRIKFQASKAGPVKRQLLIKTDLFETPLTVAIEGNVQP
jgi:hypothetical protein